MTVLSESRYRRTYNIQDESGIVYLSRRRYLDLPQHSTDILYTTQVRDKLWTIAGKPEIYNRPELWWVIAEYNNLSQTFKLNFLGFESAEQLRIPALSRVLAYLNDYR